MEKAIDILKSATSLKGAGFDKRQSGLVVDIFSDSEESIATRADIELLESRIINEIYTIGITISALVVGLNIWL